MPGWQEDCRRDVRRSHTGAYYTKSATRGGQGEHNKWFPVGHDPNSLVCVATVRHLHFGHCGQGDVLSCAICKQASEACLHALYFRQGERRVRHNKRAASGISRPCDSYNERRRPGIGFAVQNHKYRQRAFATSRRNNYQADWCERQGHRRRIPAGVGVQNVHHHKSTGTAGCQRRHGCRH